MGQALAVFQAFSLAKLRISKLFDKQSLSSKTEVLGKPLCKLGFSLNTK
jgi:hypothetical protein